MIKVIIADDEEKVCRLIHKIVDWEKLNMEVLDMAHNGLEAFKLIEALKPDIVITDIRMPGYDGIELIEKGKQVKEDTEFIIISGYRHFDYARSAIKYGVKDYLLKPIIKDELEQTLKRMQDTFDKRKQKITDEEKMRISMEQGIAKMRRSLFTEVLFQNQPQYEKNPLSMINEEFHYHLQSGCFQVLIVKMDRNGVVDEKSLPTIHEQAEKILKGFLAAFSFEMEVHTDGGYAFCLINYSDEEKKTIRKRYKLVLDKLVLQEEVFQGLKISLGIGKVVMAFEAIRTSFHTALWACEQRIISGTGKILEGELKESSRFTETALFHAFNNEISQAFDRLDCLEVRKALNGLRDGLAGRRETTGHEVYQMTKEVCNLYLFSLRKNQLLAGETDNFLEQFSESASEYSTIDQLFRFLTAAILDSMEQLIDEKNKNDKKPIRVAKAYIKEHYKESITLEEVSRLVGFNATYFSSVFKKETGSTFMEYVFDVRMEKAKELLKKTNDNIASICGQVGYSDVKYFTKNFTKHFGLKPSQYRKLYS